MRTVCCVCQRVKGEEGWVRVADMIVSRLSHGYCPECYEKAMGVLAEYRTPSRPMMSAAAFRRYQK